MKFDYSNRYKSNKNDKQEKKEIVKEEIKEKEEVIKEPIKEKSTEIEENVDKVIDKSKENLEVEKYGKLVNCELLNGRKEPDINSESLLILKKEDKIKILEELDEFYKVLVNDKEVYCMKKYINVE